MSGNESAVEGQVTEHVKMDEEAKVSAYLETVSLNQPWQQQAWIEIRDDSLWIGAMISRIILCDVTKSTAELIQGNIRRPLWFRGKTLKRISDLPGCEKK